MPSNGDADAVADAERSINDPGPGFLGPLLQPEAAPSNIRHYAYHNNEQFLRDFNQESNNLDTYFLLTGVNQQIFQTQFLPRVDEDGPFARWCSYDAELELLLFKMPESTVHAVAGMTFHNVLLRAVMQMQMDRALQPLGSGIHYGPMGAKQPDMAWRPQRQPPGRAKIWPSVVLDVVFSDTRRKLQTDLRWWLWEPEGYVKTVLTIIIGRSGHEITFEKWEKSSYGRVQRQQHVGVSKNQDVDTVTVVGSPLVIEFEKLFLGPRGSPVERDIEIGDDELEYLARNIWEEQELMDSQV
ncbi:hypothetical protein BJX61DRAFT_248967 [Aspergillus egyptiacus]|nr:hypothetical protein BJX61DRAFT_248967 [Aspergillus egyptiacus]